MIEEGTVLAVRIDDETVIVGTYKGNFEFLGQKYFNLAWPVELRLRLIPIAPEIPQVPKGMRFGAPEDIQLLKLVHSGTLIPAVASVNLPAGLPFSVITEDLPDYKAYQEAIKIATGDDGVARG